MNQLVTITGTNSLLDGESGKLVGYYDEEETQAKVFISGTLWKLPRTNLIFPPAQANLPEVSPITITAPPAPATSVSIRRRQYGY